MSIHRDSIAGPMVRPANNITGTGHIGAQNQASKMLEIPDLLNAIERNLEGLTMTVENLDARLTPLMRAGEDPIMKENTDSPTHTAFGERLNMIERAVARQNSAILHLISRLEV